MSKEVFKGYDTSFKGNIIQILKITSIKEKGKYACTELDC